MSNKKLIVSTGAIEEAAKEFIDVWHKAEKGSVSKTPLQKLSFGNQSLLFRTLTPKRFEILKYVHNQDGISIRLLAKELERDYSNVYQDVKTLHQLGLMIKNEENQKYYVPWDTIVTEIPLATIRNPKNRSASAKNSPHMNKRLPRAAHE